MVRALFPRVDSVTLTPIANPRSRPPESYLQLAKSLNSQVHIAANAEEAVTQARVKAKASGEGSVVLVAGSLFLVGHVRALLVR